MTAAVALAIFLIAFFFIATEKADKVAVVLIASGGDGGPRPDSWQ